MLESFYLDLPPSATYPSHSCQLPMPPDLNSLPISRSMASSPNHPRTMSSNITPSPDRRGSPSPGPRSSGTSLAHAASLNAADISRRNSLSRGSPRLDRVASERRRSQVAMGLALNDPTLPSPGELSSSDRRSSLSHGQSITTQSPSSIGGRGTISTGDPNHHHHRQPSLGEIHNELEQEQESQVNRLLLQIREQQLQLDALRAAHAHHSDPSRLSSTSSSANPATQSTAVIDDLTPTSERSISFPSVHPAIPSTNTNPQQHRLVSRNTSSASANRSPRIHPNPHPSQLSHEPSYSLSSTASDAWPPSPGTTADQSHTRRSSTISTRDESAYYQAETAALTRENQMLRVRIRDLEKQVGDRDHVAPNTPMTPSNLVSSPELHAEDAAAAEASQAASVMRMGGERS